MILQPNRCRLHGVTLLTALHNLPVIPLVIHLRFAPQPSPLLSHLPVQKPLRFRMGVQSAPTQLSCAGYPDRQLILGRTQATESEDPVPIAFPARLGTGCIVHRTSASAEHSSAGRAGLGADHAW